MKGDIPLPDVALTINRGTLLADVSGSIKVDIWMDTFGNFAPDNTDSIAGGNELEISGGTKDEYTTLASWDTTLDAKSVLRYNVDSASTVTRVTVGLDVSET